MSELAVRTAVDEETGEFERSADEECLATFWRQATPGTAYWRCELPARALPGQSIRFKESDIWIDEENNRLGMPRSRGTHIWQFLGDDGRSRVAFAARDAGVRTLQEVDDNYLDPSPFSHGAWTRTIAERPNGYSHEMHRILCPQFDGIIVSTEYLANVYSDWNDHIYWCPNSVDPSDWEDIPRHEDDVLRIGYYGSQSHIRDYPLVKKALKWAARQPGVEVMLLGFTPAGYTGPTLPWSNNLGEARRNLGLLDVGVCPLWENPWANGKSDVKAMEYAMAGVMPLVQTAEPYSPWWRDSGWPYAASTESDWMELIRTVVRDRELVKREAKVAKGYVMSSRTIGDSIHRWKEALDA